MKWLVGVACAAIIASSAVYLIGQYQAHASLQAAERVETKQIIESATARMRMNDDFKAWAAAHKTVSNKPENQCYVAVNKLRAINTATAAHVIPFYTDAPSALRTQINACVKDGAYTSAQVADVLD